jgi:hypothetical protein
MMEAAGISGASFYFYQITRRNIPEDSHLHIRRLENLKSRSLIMFLKQILCLMVAFKHTKHIGRNNLHTAE